MSSPKKIGKCIVAFLDVLGSTNLLNDGNPEHTEKLIDDLNNLYRFIDDIVPNHHYKTFSDNILIYSEDESDSSISSMISIVASVQYYLLETTNLFIRGGVSQGNLYYKDSEDDSDFVIGDSIVFAHNLESKNAIYPRVIIDESLISHFSDGSPDDIMVCKKSDCPYVNYLETARDEEFLNGSILESHRRSLIKHIKDDNKLNKLGSREWDSIRSKDIWSLTYHNNFCKENEMPEYVIDFTESYI